MAALQEVCGLEAHEGGAWCVAWSPDGRLLASCGTDKLVKVWGEGEGGWLCRAVLSDAHTRTVRSLAWSPCGNYLASASFDATVAIWSRKGGEFECIATLEGHENEVKAVSWARSGGLLATCSRDKSVWIWEVTDDEEFECASVLSAHSQDVKQVRWHPHRDLLASCSYDDTIKVFMEDSDDWCCCSTLKSHSSTVWGLAWDHSGSRLASCSQDATVKLWQEYAPGNPEGVSTPDDQPAWKCVCTLSGHHSRPVYSLDWSHSSGDLATAGGDDAIRIFREEGHSDKNQPAFSVVTSVRGAHSQDVNCVAWNPAEEGVLASCSDDGTLKVWRLSPDV